MNRIPVPPLRSAGEKTSVSICVNLWLLCVRVRGRKNGPRKYFHFFIEFPILLWYHAPVKDACLTCCARPRQAPAVASGGRKPVRPVRPSFVCRCGGASAAKCNKPRKPPVLTPQSCRWLQMVADSCNLALIAKNGLERPWRVHKYPSHSWGASDSTPRRKVEAQRAFLFARND